MEGKAYTTSYLEDFVAALPDWTTSLAWPATYDTWIIQDIFAATRQLYRFFFNPFMMSIVKPHAAFSICNLLPCEVEIYQQKLRVTEVKATAEN